MTRPLTQYEIDRNKCIPEAKEYANEACGSRAHISYIDNPDEWRRWASTWDTIFLTRMEELVHEKMVEAL